MSRIRSFAFAVAAVVTIAPAGASTDLGLTVATDYMMRGVRQTWSGPAYQGLVEHGFKSGIFAGLWASRVSFRAEDPRNVEVDYFAGYRKRLRPDLAFDITATRYTYPEPGQHRGYDWTEVQLAFHIADYVTVSGILSRGWLASTEVYPIIEAALLYPLPALVVLDSTIGYQFSERALPKSYGYVEVGASRSFGSFSFRVSVTATSSNGREMFGEFAETRGVAALSWSL